MEEEVLRRCTTLLLEEEEGEGRWPARLGFNLPCCPKSAFIILLSTHPLGQPATFLAYLYYCALLLHSNNKISSYLKNNNIRYLLLSKIITINYLHIRKKNQMSHKKVEEINNT